MNLRIIPGTHTPTAFEFVERKGAGHPDTLADGLAEHLSARYAQYTKEQFGVVLHHNFDKVGLLGGASDVSFGYGRLTKPIRVLLNGRASTQFGDTRIDVPSLLTTWATEFLCARLPLVEPARELVFHDNLSTQSSPGKTEERANREQSARSYWFQPRGLQDIPEHQRLFSNDTSMGVGFAPFSTLERLVLAIERRLTGTAFLAAHPWMGTDVKIMGFRHDASYELTMCIPQIGAHVASKEAYVQNLATARAEIETLLHAHGVPECRVHINTRDNVETAELYLTAIGSSIESGDEGLVGRGNRVQGFIAPMRPMSMEGAAGKNPVYHIGKIYYLAAQRISERVYADLGIANDVFLVSQSGRDLLDPWVVVVRIPGGTEAPATLRAVVEQEVARIPQLTDDLLNMRIALC